MNYEDHQTEYNSCGLRIDDITLTEKMKIEYLLDNFEQISLKDLENSVSGVVKVPDPETIRDIIMYMHEATAAISNAEDEIESL